MIWIYSFYCDIKGNIRVITKINKSVEKIDNAVINESIPNIAGSKKVFCSVINTEIISQINKLIDGRKLGHFNNKIKNFNLLKNSSGGLYV